MDVIQRFVEYLEAEKDAYLRSATALSDDYRADEANMAKVRANIYGIAASVCRASEIQAVANPIAFIKDRFKTIPQSWLESCKAAQQHGDHSKAAIERLKNETMSEIGKEFSRVLESNQ